MTTPENYTKTYNYSKEWLEHILSTYFGNNDFTIRTWNSQDALPAGVNFLGDLKSLDITLSKANNEIENYHLIVKHKTNDADLLEFSDAGKNFEKEALSYNYVIPHVKAIIKGKFTLPVANSIFADSGTDIPTIITEDLRKQGYSMIDKNSGLPLDYEHLETAFKALAKIHAGMIVWERKENIDICNNSKFSDLKNIHYPRDLLKYRVDSLLTGTQKIIEADCDSSVLATLVKLIPVAYEIIARAFDAKKYFSLPCLCHGDCWSPNFLYKYDYQKVSDFVLVDWQFLRYCSPVIDLVYVFYTCASNDVRKSKVEYLKKLYYDNLSSLCSQLNFDLVAAGYDYSEFLNDWNKLQAIGYLNALGRLACLTVAPGNEHLVKDRILELATELHEYGVENCLKWLQ